MGIPPLVMGMRYHACVWAALNGIPFIAIAYDDKVIALAQELGQPYLDLRHHHPDAELLEMYHITMNGLPDLRTRLRNRVPELCQRANQNRLAF